MKKMLHIKLLEFLNTDGIGVEKNISSFIILNFKKPTSSDKEEYDRQLQPIKIFITDLIYRGFISYYEHDANFHNSVRFGHKSAWYDTIDISVYLTSNGLDYLEKYYISENDVNLKKSYINVNDASLKNYKNQIIIGVITIGLAGSSAYMSYQSNHKADQTAISVDSLRLEISKWRLQTTQTSSQATSPMAQSRTHQPSSLDTSQTTFRKK